MTSKMDTFNATASLVFDDLYSAFPHAQPVTPNTLQSRVKELVGDDIDLPTVSRTVTWLALTGYLTREGHVQVRTSDNSIMLVESHALSDKGLSALQRVPAGLEPPLQEKLKEAVSEAGKEARKQAISAVIGEIFGGIIKGMITG